MEIVKDAMQSVEPTAYEMTGIELGLHYLRTWWILHIRRKLPMLVWYGQDVDVTVTFSDLRLAPDCTVDGIRYEGDIETLWRAEVALRQLGLSFDCGTGHNGRDWEWDYSLRGPVKLAFRRKHKGNREPKQVRPPLQIVNPR